MNEINQSDVQAILDVASKPIITTVEGYPIAIVPQALYAHPVSLEAFLPAPMRKTGRIEAATLDAFIKTIKEHKLPATRVYADVDPIKCTSNMLAIINDHGPGPAEATWRDFHVAYSTTPSVEWNRWIHKNGNPLGQMEFATFIEDNIADISTVEGAPSGADMLAMAMNFEANSEKRFSQKLVPQSGATIFEFVDNEKADVRSKMEFFQKFYIGIPVLRGGAAYRIQARIRYRVSSSGLSIWYELIRPDKTFEAAVKDEIIKLEAEKINVILGRAVDLGHNTLPKAAK